MKYRSVKQFWLLKNSVTNPDTVLIDFFYVCDIFRHRNYLVSIVKVLAFVLKLLTRKIIEYQAKYGSFNINSHYFCDMMIIRLFISDSQPKLLINS